MKLLKKNFNYFLLVLIMGMSGTAWSQMTASDERLDVEISEFETFGWVSNDATTENRFFKIIEDEIYADKIKNAVKYEMEARSYNYSNNNPDLLVTFRVLEGSAEYTGFSAGSIQSTMFDDEVRVKGYRETYFLDKGTLLIGLVQSDTGLLVWQGFASGIMDSDIYNEGETKVKEAVSKIFEEEFRHSSKQ
jgi:hypothetical protein